MKGFCHCNGGLEKDYTTGNLSTDPINHEKMVLARQEKINNVTNIIPDIQIEGNEDADLLVVGWGSTYGHLISAINLLNNEGYKVALAHFNYLFPLPKNTEKVIKRYKKVVVCELNTGQFAAYLSSKISQVNFFKYNRIQGQPFTVNELIAYFKQLLS
jgi:2-oxoglutarate ferredoxin oxidoreductase subunit alpha